MTDCKPLEDPMKPEDVPDELFTTALQAWSDNASSRPGNWSAGQQVLAVLAAVLPEHERQVRAKVAEEIEAEEAKIDRHKGTPTYWHSNGLIHAAQIARGEQP